jgi:hypothetical protein
MVSILTADYKQGQGSSTMNTGSYPTGWEEDATGIVKEAEIHYYAMGTTATGYANALDCAIAAVKVGILRAICFDRPCQESR